MHYYRAEICWVFTINVSLSFLFPELTSCICCINLCVCEDVCLEVGKMKTAGGQNSSDCWIRDAQEIQLFACAFPLLFVSCVFV